MLWSACLGWKDTAGGASRRDLSNLFNLTDKEAQKRGDQFIASEMFLLAQRTTKARPGVC